MLDLGYYGDTGLDYKDISSVCVWRGGGGGGGYYENIEGRD